MKALILNEKDNSNIKLYLLNLILKDLSESSGPPYTLTETILNDEIVRSLFSEQEVIELESNLNSSQNDLENVISTLNSDISSRLIAST